jgi:hypothetical protein
MLVVLVAACAATPATPARDVPFVEVARTQLAGLDGGPSVIVGDTDAAEGAITRSVPQAAPVPGRTLVAAFQGSMRTAGYAIRIDRIERDGERLVVHATFTEPAPGGITAQVITSPAHVVAITRQDGAGLRVAVLLDSAGTERSRTNLR